MLGTLSFFRLENLTFYSEISINIIGNIGPKITHVQKWLDTDSIIRISRP